MSEEPIQLDQARATAAGAALEAEGRRIIAALDKADALCAYIIAHAQAE